MHFIQVLRGEFIATKPQKSGPVASRIQW